jgi:hypothetical protein
MNFIVHKAFLNKPLTPYGQDAEAQNVAENVEVQLVMMKMQMLVTWVMLMLMRVLMLCHLLLLQFIPCSHSGSLLLDTLTLILLIFSSP